MNSLHLSHPKHLAFAVGLLALVSGCQVNTVRLDGGFQPPSSKRYKVTKAKCDVHLAEFVDSRQTKSLGRVGLTFVDSDVTQWALNALDFYDISKKNIEAPVSLKVSLIKAYIQALPSTMSANVVFKVQIKPYGANAYAKHRYFRGAEVDVNWNSGEGEIELAMNKAMTMATKKLWSQINTFCPENGRDKVVLKS